MARIVRPFGGVGARFGLMLALLLSYHARADALETKVVDLQHLPSLAQIVPALAEKRVVFVGEVHDQYSHHLMQLAVIRALHRRDPDIAIGMECFQQPFQKYLNAFVAGKIDEKTMLRRTHYMERWGFDYRLYRPILRYAREQHIPVIALNVPSELVAKVAESGFDGLSADERRKIPAIDRGNERYRQRLHAIFEVHPNSKGVNFEHFLDTQLLWDEGMAEKAAGYLQEHPKRHMVILAGVGHIAYRDGIPQRIERRMNATSAVVLNDPKEALSPDLADFVLLPASESLPQKGMLGLLMQKSNKGVLIASLTKESAAQAAGIEQNDRIVQIDSEAIVNPADVQLALLDRAPGDAVELAVLRHAGTDKEKLLHYRVVLR